MAIQFKTTEYEFSHGKLPKGRGSWAFSFGSLQNDVEWCPGSVTYSEARKWAQNRARELKVDIVHVRS